MQAETEMTKIRASKIAIRPVGGQRLSYDLSADIKEVSRDGAKAKLRYLLVVETYPMVMRVEMEGVVRMDVGFLGSDQTLEGIGEAMIGDLAMKIFKDNYESMYNVLDTLGLEGPSPWLTREVHLVSPAAAGA